MPVKLAEGGRGGIRSRREPRQNQKVHRTAPGSRRMFTLAITFGSYEYIWPKNAKRLVPLVEMGIELTNDSVLGRNRRGSLRRRPTILLSGPATCLHTIATQSKGPLRIFSRLEHSEYACVPTSNSESTHTLP